MQPVLVLTTGGTFDKNYFDALSRYQISDSMVGRMLAIARVTHPFRVTAVLRKDSLEITDEDREMLAERIQAEEGCRVIVIHGTDTMTRTAAVLARIPGKTIVLTGALVPARFTESDAAFNLGMAFAAAQTAPPGIYIAMNGTVFDAAHVTKDREKSCFVLEAPSTAPL
jgi:L-asparaginase